MGASAQWSLLVGEHIHALGGQRFCIPDRQGAANYAFWTLPYPPPTPDMSLHLAGPDLHPLS